MSSRIQNFVKVDILKAEYFRIYFSAIVKSLLFEIIYDVIESGRFQKYYLEKSYERAQNITLMTERGIELGIFYHKNDTVTARPQLHRVGPTNFQP